MIDLVKLKNDMLTGPYAATLAPLIGAAGTVGNYPDSQDAAVAAWYNDLAAAGAASVPISSFTKEQFMTGVLPAVVNLGSATTALQNKWDRLLGVAQNMGMIYYNVASPLLSQLVTDGLMTSAQVDAFTKRQGSYCEVLFGAGTICDHTDVARAFGRGI